MQNTTYISTNANSQYSFDCARNDMRSRHIRLITHVLLQAAGMHCHARQSVHVVRDIFSFTQGYPHGSAAYYPAHALYTDLPDVMMQRNNIVQDAEHINHKGTSHSAGAYLPVRQFACLCAW